MAKDFFGNEITVGCKVAFMKVKYRNFLLGEVVKINDKTLEIKHKSSSFNTKQFHNQVIVKN